MAGNALIGDNLIASGIVGLWNADSRRQPRIVAPIAGSNKCLAAWRFRRRLLYVAAGSPTQGSYFGTSGNNGSQPDIGASVTYVVALADNGLILSAGRSTGNMSFRTGGFNATNEKMVLTPDGNLGIGTSSPGANLDVAGTANFSGAVHIEPQGDLDMGTFTYDPNQQNGGGNPPPPALARQAVLQSSATSVSRPAVRGTASVSGTASLSGTTPSLQGDAP